MGNTKKVVSAETTTTNKTAQIKRELETPDKKALTQNTNSLYNKLKDSDKWRVYENRLLINLVKADKETRKKLLDFINGVIDNNKIDNSTIYQVKFNKDELNFVIDSLNALYKDFKPAINFSGLKYNALKVAFLSAINGRIKSEKRGVKTVNNSGYATLSPFVLALQQRVFNIATKPETPKPKPKARKSTTAVVVKPAKTTKTK